MKTVGLNNDAIELLDEYHKKLVEIGSSALQGATAAAARRNDKNPDNNIGGSLTAALNDEHTSAGYCC